MSNLNLIGAVAIKVRPDATGFREETRRKVMGELGGLDATIPVQTRLTGTGAQLKREVQRRAQAANTDILLGLNTRALDADLNRVKREMNRFDKQTVRFNADTNELDRAITAQRQAYGEVYAAQKKATDAEALYLKHLRARTEATEELARLQALMDDGDKTRKTAKAHEQAQRAIRSHATTLSNLIATRKEADEQHTKALAAQRDLAGELAEKYADSHELMKAQEAAYKRGTEALKDQFAVAQRMHTIRTGSSEQVIRLLKEQSQENEALSATLDRILSQAGELDSIEFKNLRDWAGDLFSRDRVARLRVEANTALAEAQLVALERTRSVRVLAYVDSSISKLADQLRAGGELDQGISNIKEKYSTMFAGGLAAASGVSLASRMTSYMAQSAIHMDKLAVASSAAAVGVGSLVGAMGAGIGLFSAVALDIGALAKGAAILPSALLAFGPAAATSARGLSVLKDALGGNVEELEALAPAVVPAIGSLRELWGEADRVGKTRFLENMANELEAMPASVEPLTVLWTNAYSSQGRFFSGVLAGVRAWHASGGMDTSVQDISKALDNASDSAQPFIQALTDMAEVGATFLPALGSGLSGASQDFARFIRAAKETGDLAEWIEEAGRQVTYLGGAAKGAVGIVQGLGSAAREAGFDGMRSLSEGLQAASNELNSPVWQSGMTQIFRGAYDGSKLAGAGFRDLARSVIDTSSYWESFGRLSGSVVGQFLSHLGEMNRQSRFLSGLYSLYGDLDDIAGRSEGTLRNLGNVMGDGAMLAGKLADGGHRVVDAFLRAWGGAGKLTQGLGEFIPVAGQTVASLIDMASALASPILDGAGGLLSSFASLPQPVITATAVLGLFTLALSKLRSAGGGNVLAGLGAQFPILGSLIEGTQRKVDAFRGGWSSMTSNLRAGSSFTHAQSQLSFLGREFGNVGRFAGQSALGVSQLRAALTVGHFDTAAAGAGRFSTALQGVKNTGFGGVRSAAAGLVGFMGGPWGLAFAAAGAALGVFAAETAESKRHLESLQTSLSSSGEVTEATVRQLTQGFENYGNAVSNWFDSANQWTMNLIPGVEQIWKFDEAVRATGMNTSQLGRDVADSGGNWSEYREALEEANRIIDQNGSLSEEQAKALFGSADAAKITGATFQDLRSEWDRQNDALKEAQQKHREYSQAMGVTSAEGRKLHGALKVLGDETSTSAQKAGAFVEAMDLMNGGTRSFLNSLSGQSQAMGSLASAFEQVAQAGKGGAGAFVEYTNALGDTSYRLDTTVGELAALDGALQSSYDKSVAHAQAVFDNARAQGKSVSEATALAQSTMSTWRSEASRQLQAMGADAKQAEAYLDDIAGKPWHAEVIFMGKTEHFMKAQAAVEQAGRKFNGEAFTAFLKANPDLAVKDIEALVRSGMNWSSSTYSASLLADGTDAQAALDEIISRGQDFTDTEYMAALEGDNSGFLDAVITAKADGADFNNSEWRSKLGIDSREWNQIYPNLIRDGETFGSKQWVARMDMENPGFAEKFYAAEANLMGLTGQEWHAHVTSNVGEVAQAQGALLGSLSAMHGTVSEVTVSSNVATQLVMTEAYKLLLEGMSGQEVQQHLKLNDAQWNEVVSALPGNWDSVKADLESKPVVFGVDTAGVNTGVETARSTLGEFAANYKPKAELGATDTTPPVVEGARANLGASWTGHTFTSNLSGNATPFSGVLGGAVGAGLGWAGRVFTSALSGDPARFSGAVGSAVGAGVAFAGRVFTSTLAGNGSRMLGAVGGAISSGLGFASRVFTSTISGNPSRAYGAISGAISAGSGWAWRAFTATISARNGYSGVISAAFQAGWSWAGKVFTATLSAVRKGIFADGGIMLGGPGGMVQAFANGGVRAPENHRAFIAPPSAVHRVWAEPETGGEAYIPLAVSKRSRSSQILGQVAERFGYTVTKHYANGGADFVGGVPAAQAVGGGSIDYRRLARAVASAMPDTVHLGNPEAIRVVSSRR